MGKSYWQQYDILRRNAAGVHPDQEVLPNLPQYEGKNVVAEDWCSIPRGYCRCCKQKIPEPYKKVYHGIYPGQFQVSYGYKNFYCEECAKKKAAEKHKPAYRPNVTDVTRDMYGHETVTYDDGCVSTELDINQTYKGEEE